MERIGVIRENGVVMNVILWADHTPEQLILDGITDFEEVTDISPRPGINWTFSASDGYRPPKPYQSWVWSGDQWTAPKAMPTDGKAYQWDESSKKWVALPEVGS